MSKVVVGIITTVVGGLFLAYLTGVFGLGGGSGSPGNLDSPPVTIYITGRLVSPSISSQAKVVIDGKEAGVLSADQSNTTDQISHTVPQPGTYSYTIEGVTVSPDAYGTPQQTYGSGQGNIDIEQGSTFEVRGSVASGNTYQMSLVED
jgi:hypothetical protein